MGALKDINQCFIFVFGVSSEHFPLNCVNIHFNELPIASIQKFLATFPSPLQIILMVLLLVAGGMRCVCLIIIDNIRITVNA